MSVSQQARGKWPAILETLGVPSSVLDGKHHACPCSGEGRDRFRFDPNKDYGAFVCHCTEGRFAGGFDFLKCYFGWDFPEAAKQVESVVGSAKQAPKKDRPDPAIALRKIWAESEANGFVVRKYLKSRGITANLKQHSRLPYYDAGKCIGHFYAMIGLVCDKQGPVSLHTTYLDQAGAKAPVSPCRKMRTPIRPLSGAYWVELKKGTGKLFVAEGIETALSAIPLFGASWVYSVISTDGMRKFEAPQNCNELIILADNDKNYAGQSAAFSLAEKTAKKGIKVTVLVPPNVGDWNDELVFKQGQVA